MIIARTSKRSRRRGAHLVEMAFVLMFFFLMLMAIIQYGYVLFLRQMAQNAVREAARTAAVGNSDSTGYNYQSDTAIKTVAYNLITPKVLFNTGGSPFAVSDVIVNHVNASTMATIGGNNDGSWIGNIPSYNSSATDALEVKIDALYKPVFRNFFSNNTTIPIQAIAVVRSEGN